MMLSRNDIPYIKHFDDASKIFGNTVSIEGGINYFLKDVGYTGQCNYNNVMLNLNDCDILIESKYLPLINKINTFPKLIDRYRSKGYYEIPLTDKRLHDILEDNDIKCYVSQMKGFNKFIKKHTIKNDKLGQWQIITPSANGGKGCFGNIIIGTPNDVYSETYISFAVDAEFDAKSLFSYIKCRLPNMLLSLRKISQNISRDTCKWIPLPPLNKEWTDDEVYKHFKLSEDDIKLINETNIVGYKNIVNQTESIVETPESKPKRVCKKKIQVPEPADVDAVIEPKIKTKRVYKKKIQVQEPADIGTVVEPKIKTKRVYKKKIQVQEPADIGTVVEPKIS